MIEDSNGDTKQALGITEEFLIYFDTTKASIQCLVSDINAIDILLGLPWFKQTGVILDPKNEQYIITDKPKINRNYSRAFEEDLDEEDDDEDREEQNSSYNKSLAFISLENDEMEYVDDDACFSKIPFDPKTMKPASELPEEIFNQFNKLIEEKRHYIRHIRNRTRLL